MFIPLDQSNPKDGLLWVNHEYVNPLFVSNFDSKHHDNRKEHRTIEQVDKEMYAVGGSIVRVKEENGKWEVVKNDPHNRRFTAQTPIPLNWDTPIEGKTTAIVQIAIVREELPPGIHFLPARRIITTVSEKQYMTKIMCPRKFQAFTVGKPFTIIPRSTTDGS